MRPNQGNVGAYRRMVKAGLIPRDEAARIVGKDVFLAQGSIPAEDWDGVVDPTGRGDGRLWPTPQHHDSKSGQAERAERGGTGGGCRNLSDEVLALPGQPEIFPTPTGTERAGTNPETGKGGGLSRHVKDQMGLFPTPRAANPNMEKEESWRAKHERGDVSTPPLSLAARMWPSPVASDQKPRRKTANWAGSDLVSTVTEAEELNGAVLPKSGGQLNPDWVEPLMGYRCGTTRIVPEAAAWLKVDAKRLKAADLKKIHSLDEHVEVEEPEAEAEDEEPEKP